MFEREFAPLCEENGSLITALTKRWRFLRENSKDYVKARSNDSLVSVLPRIFSIGHERLQVLHGDDGIKI
ncbi:MAG: hypothetical protein ACTIKR_17960 [Advenella sp.]|uniref:hypothetical protein n=1 Tax=unclassified Advenella TaxID=2685285 RepID=UPI001866E228|nr:hypothetical protein [Advenella sp. FME57]